jgi:hypothetical protein
MTAGCVALFGRRISVKLTQSAKHKQWLTSRLFSLQCAQQSPALHIRAVSCWCDQILQHRRITNDERRCIRLIGFATFLAGLLASRSSKKKFETMLDRLGRRGVISGTDGVKNAIDQMAARWTRIVAMGVALSILGAFVAVMISDPLRASQRIGLCLFETAWAYVAGKRIGLLVAYGRLGSYLRASNTPLRVFPGHIDGAAGLKPVGAFCSHQALSQCPANLRHATPSRARCQYFRNSPPSAAETRCQVPVPADAASSHRTAHTGFLQTHQHGIRPAIG